MTIVKIAENKNAVLKIMVDENAQNPREWDNLGTMVCFHRRYNLGDQHSYRDPREFLEELAYEFIDTPKAQEVIKKLVDKEFEGFTIEESVYGEYFIKSSYGYNPFGFYTYDTYEEAEADLESEKENWVENYAIQELEDEELIEIIEANAVILPLYLYDHSGITMSTKPFSCRWDSGQVGWIYVTHEDIVKEFGHLDIEKTKKTLEKEVKEYDQYLTDDVYGYVLENKDGEVIDSCWGFYGGLEWLENELKYELPEEYKDLVNKLEYV